MAFLKTLTLAPRFITKSYIRAVASTAPAVSRRSTLCRFPSSGENLSPVRRPFYGVVAEVPPERPTLPFGERVCLGGHLLPPPATTMTVPLDILDRPAGEKPAERLQGCRPPRAAEAGLTVEEVRKVLRAAQIEGVRSRLQSDPRRSISYQELLLICGEASGADQAPEVARSLDESGAVIVFGEIVFLRPDQLAREIENVIASPPVVELTEMEERKATIDKKAAAQARMELWWGLGFLGAETAGFMALTFWYLSWDVMEPICFFGTAIHGIGAYIFFSKTMKEPSFQAFTETRFATKQKRLMRAEGFNLERFTELKNKFPTGLSHCNQGEGFWQVGEQK